MYKLKHVFLDEETGGEEGSSGGGALTAEELQAQLAELERERDSMKAKMTELLGEKKKEQSLRREAEILAKREAEEKAKKEGDFEQLFKSSQQQAEEYKSQLESLKQSIANQNISGAAMKLAIELADGDNAEILSEFIARRLKYTDEGIKVTDNNGDLTVSSLEQLKTEFMNNKRFASLLRGSQATGGSANGSASTSGSTKKPEDYSEQERVQLFRDDPALFKQLFNTN